MKKKIAILSLLALVVLQLSSCFVEVRGPGYGRYWHRHHHHGYYRYYR